MEADPAPAKPRDRPRVRVTDPQPAVTKRHQPKEALEKLYGGILLFTSRRNAEERANLGGIEL